VPGTAWAAAHSAYRAWSPVQRGFFWLGLAQLATAAVHALLASVLGGPLSGPVSIRKPILFAQSFGLVSLGFAFFWNDLALPKPAVAFLGWFSIVLSAIEVAFAVMQFWRGVPSHFNYTTLFDGLVAGSMTAGAVIFALFLAWVSALSWTRSLHDVPLERQSLVYGLRLSLPLALFGLAAVGLVMLLNGGEAWHGLSFLESRVSGFRLGRYNGQPAGLVGGGSLMLAHALGTHAFQILPLAGWLAGRHGAPERDWRPRVLAVAGCYALVMTFATLQALWIQAPVREGGLMAALLVAACVALAAAVAGLFRPFAPSAQAA
jgi:hypothetical protein